MMQVAARTLDRFTALNGHSWSELFGDAPEGFDYFRACEEAVPSSFKFGALAALDGDTLMAGAPVFETAISLDLALDGFARTAMRGLGKLFPALSTVPLIGIGTPHSHDSNLVFRSDLEHETRLHAFTAMLATLEDAARHKKSDIILLKDVNADIRALADEVLTQRGYARLTTLPIATLTTPSSEAAYLEGLSQNMRSNLRRRLKRAKNVRVEARSSAEGLEEQLRALQASTRERATTDYDVFEELSPDYYSAVMRALGDRAKLLTYWLGNEMIGFSLVLLGRDKLVQTYNGMRYPEGPDNGLFYLDWMTQVRLCIEHDIPLMQSGVTTYVIKARLGCKLHRSYLYVRHRNRVMNAIIKAASPWIRLEAGDPGLKELGATAPYV